MKIHKMHFDYILLLVTAAVAGLSHTSARRLHERDDGSESNDDIAEFLHVYGRDRPSMDKQHLLQELKRQIQVGQPQSDTTMFPIRTDNIEEASANRDKNDAATATIENISKLKASGNDGNKRVGTVDYDTAEFSDSGEVSNAATPVVEKNKQTVNNVIGEAPYRGDAINSVAAVIENNKQFQTSDNDNNKKVKTTINVSADSDTDPHSNEHSDTIITRPTSYRELLPKSEVNSVRKPKLIDENKVVRDTGHKEDFKEVANNESNRDVQNKETAYSDNNKKRYRKDETTPTPTVAIDSLDSKYIKQAVSAATSKDDNSVNEKNNKDSLLKSTTRDISRTSTTSIAEKTAKPFSVTHAPVISTMKNDIKLQLLERLVAKQLKKLRQNIDLKTGHAGQQGSTTETPDDEYYYYDEDNETGDAKSKNKNSNNGNTNAAKNHEVKSSAPHKVMVVKLQRLDARVPSAQHKSPTKQITYTPIEKPLYTDKAVWIGVGAGSGFSIIMCMLCCCLYRCLLYFRSRQGIDLKAVGLCNMTDRKMDDNPMYVRLSQVKNAKNGSHYVVSILDDKKDEENGWSSEEEVFNVSAIHKGEAGATNSPVVKRTSTPIGTPTKVKRKIISSIP